jgi:ABC-type Fe3+-hydroxamate transport system substrate-binding protein
MKHLILAAWATCMSALPAMAQITLTDIDGRDVTLASVPERVALGFYYEDYLAVAGAEGVERLVSLSRAPWADWRPGQWAAYTARFPRLKELPNFGNADDNSFSVEATDRIAARCRNPVGLADRRDWRTGHGATGRCRDHCRRHRL